MGWKDKAQKYFSDVEIKGMDQQWFNQFMNLRESDRWKLIYEGGHPEDFSKLQQNKNKKWMG